MGDVFLANGFTEDDIYDVADVFDLHKDGYITFDEFCTIVEGEPADGEAGEDAAEPPPDESYTDENLVTAIDMGIQKFKTNIDLRFDSMRKAFLTMDTDRKS